MQDHSLSRFRDWFAASLGVRPERKEEIYLDLSRSASLRDPAYWLQILFAAGIATLGLVLNSPAVIIGAMLISPLMGPILASGLALAAGDLILGLRAGASLAVSCLVAIAFSVLLVGLLPFKEMTGEIAARTQPNTLDLFVALFSGAIGSIAICKEVKGVVTSIPGVAIAVALMPPLCVVGYGLGVAVSVSGAEGWRVARGGGLLFLTNLVAITFTAMMVFLALHIDIEPVKERVREWRRSDPESLWVRLLLIRFHLSDKVRNIGGVPARLLGIFIPMVLILIPLSQSLSQLKQEITHQQQENRTRRIATETWRQNFEQLPGGETRSYLDQLTISELTGKLTVYLRVFTSKPYTAAERTEWTRLLAARLDRPADSVGLQLIEIPTASSELIALAREPKRAEAPPSVAQLRANFWQGVEVAFRDLRFPPSVRLINYRVITSTVEPIQIVVTYLGDHELDADAQALVIDDIRSRVSDPAASVSFERIPAEFDPIVWRRNQAALAASDAIPLDRAGQILQQYPKLRAEIITNAEKNERENIAQERAQAIIAHLAKQWQIASDRLSITLGAEPGRSIKLKLSSSAPAPTTK